MPIESAVRARPSGVIPGVYKYCDDWCDCCSVTARCVSYRVRRDWVARHGTDVRNLDDMVAFTREVAAASGTTTDGLDAMLAGDPRREYQPAPADEWLVCEAHAYAAGAGFLLQKAGWVAPATGAPPVPPTALDMIAWYHLLIATRLGRALVAAARADRGIPGELEDAQGSAKISLISIDRSRTALKRLPVIGDRRIIRDLVGMLDALATGLEARVPGARNFVRPGLDAPVV